MKKLLVALLFFAWVSGYPQVTPSGIIRVANSTTPFNETVPAGKNIVDNGAGKQYLVLLPLANTKTIATCTLGTDIKELNTLTNPVAGTGVSGYIPHFTGASLIDSTGLYWNAGTKRLGLGLTNTSAIFSLGARAYPIKFLFDEEATSKAGFSLYSSVYRYFVPTYNSMAFGHLDIADGSTFTKDMEITSAGAVNVVNALTASSFAVPGGTSAQYLLRDGSYTTVAGSVYKGELSGTTGIPVVGGSALINGTGTAGWYYACADGTAGTYDYGNPSGNSIALTTGGILYYTGSVWIRQPSTSSYVLPKPTTTTIGGVLSNDNVSVNASTGGMTVATNANLTGPVTSSGNATTITDEAVTYAKMQHVSATDKVLGRVTAGAGDVEEIATTGSGNVVRATSPTLVTPALGTPASGVLTNCTGLPAASVTGILGSTYGGTGVNNGGRNLTISSYSGTINFSAVSKTLTVPLDASVSGINTGDQTSVTGNAGTVTVANNTTNATYYLLFATGTNGSYAPQTTTERLTFNPSTGNLMATIFQLSDRRYKNHIKPLDRDDFWKIGQIDFHKCFMNDDPSNMQHYVVIAQEVEKILPELVDSSNPNKKIVNYQELLLLKVAQLERVIKDQEKRIEKLEHKNHWKAGQIIIQ